MIYIKKRRTTKVYPDEKLKQRGALKELVEMPLDILLEVCDTLEIHTFLTWHTRFLVSSLRET